jgi:CHAD domain-containing protein
LPRRRNRLKLEGKMAHELKRARKALRELESGLKKLSVNPRPSEVHRLRIAARRVEAIVTALRPSHENRARRLLKSIGPMRKAAGGVREIDVLLANARRLARYSVGEALTRLLEHLCRARQKRVKKLRRRIEHGMCATRTELKEYSKLLGPDLVSAKSNAADEVPAQRPPRLRLAAMEAAHELGWPSKLDAKNIHAFRLKVKRLRYILQLSDDADAVFLGTLAAVQGAIGDWHDWQQLRTVAREVLTRGGDEALLERIDRIVQRTLEQALTTANSLLGRYLASPTLALAS